MPQHFKLVFFLFFSFYFINENRAQTLTGTVVEAETLKAIPATHVINKRTLKGNLTGNDGKFSIPLQWNDTIIFSNISYQYFYFVYNDSSTFLNNVLIEMKEQNFLLNEVSIFSYKLTSNEDKEIVLQEPLYPKSENLGNGRIVNATAANPAEFLYNLFGSKPRQLRMLAQLKAEEAYREKLEESNNRESVVALTGLSKDELEAFMFYCKFSPVRMNTLNDYEFLISVQYCYQEYVRERRLEEFLEQFD